MPPTIENSSGLGAKAAKGVLFPTGGNAGKLAESATRG